ncbi:sulfurtransferase [Aquincola sp. S2]|uniref:Sulfurtransferase n=1 Tax=Pseudaquabacterium terrae TaxID=2732868 RepID=A0ABX2EG71_9BURK|nr:sulfurtransferase [Aquabacterium terrae]NRF67625.1 sulfurtransferase [Aquabacterium terrae]
MSPLISAAELKALLATSPDVLVCDCSFDLTEPQAGARAFAAAHVPGAVYVHVDKDLSAAKTGLNGRHPLPERAWFAARMAELGVNQSTWVIACDNAGGMYAARLWWMLRWIGHAGVRVLDGGVPAWRAAGGEMESGAAVARPAGDLALRPSLVEMVDFAELRSTLGRGRRLIVDARAADRFRGENETLDPVAGHIPGAANRFFRDNLGADGAFKPAAQLRAEWLEVMAGRAPTDLVQHCGSGVTGCHNLLAMEAAGLSGARLYPGSWSEWCAQPGAPVAIGS